MAKDANVHLTGHLVKDPILGTNQKTNKQSLYFPLAVQTMVKKKDGTGYETNFYDVTVWNDSIEYLMNNLRKGTMVNVQGTQYFHMYYTEDTKEPRMRCSVNASDVRILMPKRQQEDKTEQETVA